MPVKFIARAAIALALSIPTLAAASADIRFDHAQGAITLPKTPTRIFVYDLASLDILDALGVDVAGVPNTRFPAYLQKYGDNKRQKIGSLFEPDLEAVNAASPDLIIVGGRSRAKFAQLSKMAPTVDMSIDAKDPVASVKANVEKLGRVFGKEERSRSLIADLERDIAALRAQASGAGKGLLVLTSGARMSAYGPGSRFGVLHTGFNVTPAVNDLATTNHGQSISSEFILKVNPDWLFVIDRDAAVGRAQGAAQRSLDNELVRKTKAWEKKQVVYLDPVQWYLVGGGVQALHASVRQLSEALSRK